MIAALMQQVMMFSLVYVTCADACVGNLQHADRFGQLLLAAQTDDTTNCAWMIRPKDALAVKLDIIASRLSDTDLVTLTVS